MRIFVAGASGVIGIRLVPLLVAAGQDLAGLTRSPEKLAAPEALGAEPFLCDVYDTTARRAAVVDSAPIAVIHQLTDLPDDAAMIPKRAGRHDRMLRDGTRNLLDAAAAAHPERFLAQSIAAGTNSRCQPSAPTLHAADGARAGLTAAQSGISNVRRDGGRTSNHRFTRAGWLSSTASVWRAAMSDSQIRTLGGSR